MADEEKEGEVTQSHGDEEREGEVTQSRGDGEIEGEGTQSRGVDWEVVSLTESTYAAAPNTKELGPNNNNDESNQESSNAMFLSGHFVFPPNEHENLPIEPEVSEIHNESEDQSFIIDEEDVEVIESFDEVEYEQGKRLQGLDSIHYPKSSDHGDTSEVLDKDVESPRKNVKSSEGDECDESGHPCAAWLKKHATSLYCHAKEANTFWSIVVAAALTGLVILGKRWHKDKWHVQEFRGHLMNDKKMKGVMGPIGRLKNIIMGSHQRGSVIGSGVAASQ